MKALFFNKKTLIAVIIMSFSLHGMITQKPLNGLAAQSLLHSEWFLADSEINGVSISTQVLGATIETLLNEDSFLLIYGNSCFEYITVPYSNVTNNSFILGPIEDYTQCNYTDPNVIAAVELYKSFYFQLPINGNGTPNNPFGYELVDNGNPVLDLEITNPNGDWLLFTTNYLSLSDFSKDSFTIYPNPVKKTLKVNNISNQLVTATIYDIKGKLLQNHTIETSTSTIDVKAFNPGLYFVVFESEAGERVVLFF